MARSVCPSPRSVLFVCYQNNIKIKFFFVVYSYSCQSKAFIAQNSPSSSQVSGDGSGADVLPMVSGFRVSGLAVVGAIQFLHTLFSLDICGL